MALLTSAALKGRCPICGAAHAACTPKEGTMPRTRSEETPESEPTPSGPSYAIVTEGAEPTELVEAQSQPPGANLQPKEVEVARGVTTTFLVDEDDAARLEDAYGKRRGLAKNKAREMPSAAARAVAAQPEAAEKKAGEGSTEGSTE